MNKTLFEQFGFKEFINNAIVELQFYEPTDIQARLIPAILRGESVIGQSQTGTGKTHAFLLPLLNKIDPDRQEVQVVITAPTRELAQQIYEEVQKVISFNPAISAKNFIGGTDKQRTIEKLKTQPHIVVGTPGRINDLIKEKALLAYTADAMVVDEADLMLDMGFIVDVDQISAKMKEDLQLLVFSATIPEKLKPFLKKYMENPKYSHVEPKQITAAKIEHYLIPLKHRNKPKLLVELCKSINPYLAIIFTNTKKMADVVADHLSENGITVGIIHGDLPPRERKKMMKQINEAEFQFVVATDLAARGIDIKGISHVINYEIPSDLDFYVHRVGRTARAGLSGLAVTIYEPSDEDALNRLEKLGISFSNVDIRNDEWVEIGPREKRKARKKEQTDIDKKAKSFIQKPKKVKPGYKKKLQEQTSKYKKTLQRKDSNKR
ncbi:ATP-dependent RNA helicase CshB [Bacillus mesophilus]|uniref:DEAD-box ATP-dependent RNA helicase CshB n=1 Tax=Bacillus mesophilus TaxID=1808955 RepID=A0A6M0Q812_9BACI|nr:DEAD/DEAH box helicase [Bacillus mesophilus]MBM7660813.1 ATP-dependent RNA helicase CshB [Bacillus mesophilus]NEY71640.1 DEAD/DEAH box helicase [Bacillus mesophilus]